jgi:hypothetical protein
MRTLKLSISALAIAGVMGSLGGCATVSVPTLHAHARPPASPVDAGVDWAWSVAGDAAVRPLQVFSAHGKTYLQMRQGQMLPAVLVGGVPVSFAISSPYIVIQGEPARMDIVANGYRAVVVRQSQGPAPGRVMPALQPSRVHRVSMAGKGAVLARGATAQPQPVSQPAVQVAALAPVRAPVALPVSVSIAAPASAARAAPAVQVERVRRVRRARPVEVADAPSLWRVDTAQGRLSRVVRAWGARSGVQVRWDAPVDVPVRASGVIKARDFYGALAQALREASSGGWTFAMEFAPRGGVVIRAYQAGRA